MPPRSAACFPKPDSIATNPDASRFLTLIVSSVIVQTGDKARKWYEHESYTSIFSLFAAKNSASDSYSSLTKNMDIKQNISSILLKIRLQANIA